MTKSIHLNIFDPASINKAIRDIEGYKKWLWDKAEQLAQRLAEYGLRRVEMGYAAAVFDGDKDVTVKVEPCGKGKYAIVASGTKLLLLEFGSGIKYGAGHPQAGKFGYGPGTYPGQTHVPDPGFWWYTGSDGKSHYSVGNAPSAVMYLTGIELRLEIERIAKEVFRS